MTKQMDIVTILRELWRRRILVGLVAVAAVAVGILVAYRFSPLPPKLESRSYDVAVATARMFVDTPDSQVVDVSPKGSETLGMRAGLLSTLMVEGSVKEAIAKRVGMPPSRLITTAESAPGSEGGPPLPKPGPDDYVVSTRVVLNTVQEQLPIIEIEAQAPKAAAAAALANATVSGLSDYLDSKAASEQVADGRRLRVSGLGPAQVVEVHRGPQRSVVLVVALLAFVAGCALIVIVPRVARGWREAEASEWNTPAPQDEAPFDQTFHTDLLAASFDGDESAAAPSAR